MNKSLRISDKSENIIKSYINCCNSIRNVYKSAKNTHQNYKYATLEDVIDSIRDELSSNNLAILSSVVEEPKRLDPRQSKSGLVNYNIEVKITIRLIHESGEWMEVDCYGEGQDSGDKAMYKAITGAKKYGIQNLFGIATTDDPEKDDNQSNINNKTLVNKKNNNPLVDSFKSIGITWDEISNRYNVLSVDELSNDELSDLRRIFKEIKENKDMKVNYFK